jgi:hypothetical protein
MFGSSLYTGVPVMTNIGVSVTNPQHTASEGFSTTNYLSHLPGSAHPMVTGRLGGIGPLNGNLFLMVDGVRAVQFPLSPVGAAAGGTFKTTVVGIPFSNTYMPWLTGPVPITGITTNVVSYNGVTGAAMTLRIQPGEPYRTVSTGMGFVSTNNGLPSEYRTVTPSGPNNLLSGASTISGTASVTLISPIRINTSPSVQGRIPGAVWLDLVFVPEPGTLLLLVTGAIGLAVIGRRRMRG